MDLVKDYIFFEILNKNKKKDSNNPYRYLQQALFYMSKHSNMMKNGLQR